ncbi:MAG: metallophosphoesterase [Clostridia bacterium]|nr:metallophosphoesterase [Clostridia bacterium]
MKILILSDSHGFSQELEAILKKERNADMIIHLGDGGKDMFDMNEYTAFKPVYQIKGNCDTSAYNFPLRLISYAEKVKFLACHGHAYNVKLGLSSLYYAAKEEECAVALYGHTHIVNIEEYDGVTLFNPGSIMNGKYGIMEVTGERFTLKHCKIDE